MKPVVVLWDQTWEACSGSNRETEAHTVATCQSPEKYPASSIGPKVGL